MSPGAHRSLRSALRQVRGALTMTNRALQSVTLSAGRRSTLEASRKVLLAVEETYQDAVSEPVVRTQEAA